MQVTECEFDTVIYESLKKLFSTCERVCTATSLFLAKQARQIGLQRPVLDAGCQENLPNRTYFDKIHYSIMKK